MSDNSAAMLHAPVFLLAAGMLDSYTVLASGGPFWQQAPTKVKRVSWTWWVSASSTVWLRCRFFVSCPLRPPNNHWAHTTFWEQKVPPLCPPLTQNLIPVRNVFLCKDKGSGLSHTCNIALKTKTGHTDTQETAWQNSICISKYIFNFPLGMGKHIIDTELN